MGKIDFRKTIILDGAIGTTLMARGLCTEICFEKLNVTNPEAIKQIYIEYLDAGSDIIYTNTFGASRMYNPLNDDVKLWTGKGVSLARECADKYNALVAASIGPLGMLMPFSEKMYAVQAQAAQEFGADIIVLETAINIDEVKLALKAIREVSSLPIFVSMYFKDDLTALDGTTIEHFVRAVAPFNVAAIGANCISLPSAYSIAKELNAYSEKPVFIKANGGIYTYNQENIVSPQAFAETMLNVKNLGVNILGGCCGTTADHIKALKASVL